MSLNLLEEFFPKEGVPFFRKWIEHHAIHFVVTRDRASKLGDYKKLPNGGHKITINATLSPDLFFFVLTHELAHLIARETYGREILPHGSEWKHTYRNLLLESISVYPKDLQPLIVQFSKAPKANFMASTDLVRYFFKDKLEKNEVFLCDLDIGHSFVYRKQEFKIFGRNKKTYLCKNLVNERVYHFQPLASVQKI